MHDPHEKNTPHAASPPSASDQDRAARSGENQLIRRALPLVDMVARRLWHRWGRRHELEELAAIGRAALVPAVRAYDPQRAPFGPYVAQRLQWAIQDSVRSQSHARSSLWRRAAAAADGPYLAVPPASACWPDDADSSRAWQAGRPDLVSGGCCGPVTSWGALAGAVDPSRSPELLVLRKVEVEKLREAITQLPARQRALIVSHYFHGRRFDHIAERLGISKSWASRLHRRALGRLARALRRSARPSGGDAGFTPQLPLAA